MARGAARERIVAQLLVGAPDDDPRAATLLHDAGRDALAKGAPAAAALHLLRALDSAPPEQRPARLLTDLGVALVLDDRPDEAVPLLRRALDADADSAETVRRTLALWLALLSTGQIDEGLAVLEAEIAALGGSDREAALMLEGEFVTAALFDPSRIEATWRRLDHFADLAGDTPAERRLLSMMTAKSQYAVAKSADELAAMSVRAYGEGRLVEENPMDPTKWVWAVGALVITDRVAESEAALAVAFASARATGSLETLCLAQNLRAWRATRLGRLADGEADAVEALGRLVEIESNPLRGLLRLALVRWALAAMVERGRLEEADDLLVQEGMAGDPGDGPQHVKLHFERGLLRLAQGRPEDGLAEAVALGAFQREYGIEDVAEAPWRPVAALAHVALGDLPGAAVLAEEHLALVRRWGLPRDLGAALRVRALAEGSPREREALLVESLATLARSPAPLERARTEAELGRTLARAGRRSEAREALGRALEGAARCEAGPLAAMARTELEVAGAKPRRPMLSGVEALTAAERRIADLAADGRSNREIAQDLFLSVRTVENTLARSYRKLAIRSRRELADALVVEDG
jgi:DNA-binding CsgD family transcriptional regulator